MIRQMAMLLGFGSAGYEFTCKVDFLGLHNIVNI